MKTQTIPTTFVLTFALAACGGPGGEGAPVSGKGDAAQAAARVQQTGDSLQSSKSQGLVAAQTIPGIDQDGVNATTEWTVDGAEGSAKITLDASVTGGDVQASYVIEYDAYSSDGVDFIDGRIEYTSSVSTGGDGVSVRHSVKGSAVIWGTQAADLVLDATLSVDVGGAGGSVNVTMDGSVTADGQTFTYDGEAFDLSADVF